MRKTILAVLASVILVACNKPQPVQVKQTPAETVPAQDDPSQPRLATLAQQKMCAEQSEKQFNSTGASKSSAADFTSHYDARANVCYIMVHDAGVSYGNPTVSDVVYDAYEGRVYANYMWINSQKKKYWEVGPMECDVKPRGQPEITCKSSNEFEELIDKYFGIGR